MGRLFSTRRPRPPPPNHHVYKNNIMRCYYLTDVCVFNWWLRQSPNKFDPTRLIRAELADTIKLDTPRVA